MNFNNFLAIIHLTRCALWIAIRDKSKWPLCLWNQLPNPTLLKVHQIAWLKHLFQQVLFIMVHFHVYVPVLECITHFTA